MSVNVLTANSLKMDSTETIKYKSKYDWWILAVLLMPLAILIGIVIYDFSLVLLICMIPCAFGMWLVADCLINTCYEIDDKTLRVKCGVLVNERIDIMTVKSIRPSKTWFSSPAWSMDRIEIVYGKYGKVIISPKNKEDLINNLVKINSDIKVTE